MIVRDYVSDTSSARQPGEIMPGRDGRRARCGSSVLSAILLAHLTARRIASWAASRRLSRHATSMSGGCDRGGCRSSIGRPARRWIVSRHRRRRACSFVAHPQGGGHASISRGALRLSRSSTPRSDLLAGSHRRRWRLRAMLPSFAVAARSGRALPSPPGATGRAGGGAMHTRRRTRSARLLSGRSRSHRRRRSTMSSGAVTIMAVMILLVSAASARAEQRELPRIQRRRRLRRGCGRRCSCSPARTPLACRPPRSASPRPLGGKTGIAYAGTQFTLAIL